jgi:CubicO group peptidase (beta-lactamase class C family)
MEEGKLLLTDPVSKYVPSFAMTTVATRMGNGVEMAPARREITLRDLLTHTAGISYGTGSSVAALYAAKGFGPAAGFGWYFADKDEPVCDSIDRLGTLPFVAQPGESWVYGYGNDIMGCVIERASKQPLDVFIRERITAPLKMNDTFFFVPRDKASRLTAVYASGADGKAVRAEPGAKGQGAYVDGPRRNFSGGAGLVSTAEDYARFLEMIRRGGELDGVRILSPRSAALMTVNASGTLHSGPAGGLGYSIAFETVETFGAKGLSSAGAYGWGGAYGSVYRVDPAERLTMVYMMQLIPDGTDLQQKVPNLVYQALVR